jgi:cell division protein FtsW (lipid II flippase)
LLCASSFPGLRRGSTSPVPGATYAPEMADAPTPTWRRIVFWLACAFVLVAVVVVLLDDRPWSEKQLPLGFAVLFLVGVVLRIRERRRDSR